MCWDNQMPYSPSKSPVVTIYVEQGCSHGTSNDTQTDAHILASSAIVASPALSYLKVTKGDGTLLPQGVAKEDRTRDAATLNKRHDTIAECAEPLQSCAAAANDCSVFHVVAHTGPPHAVIVHSCCSLQCIRWHQLHLWVCDNHQTPLASRKCWHPANGHLTLVDTHGATQPPCQRKACPIAG